MTLGEKAGLMVHHTAPSVMDAAGNPVYDLGRAPTFIVYKGINHFVTRMTGRASLVAAASNSRISAVVPAVVTVYLDRPAVLTNIRDKAAALAGNFGINDDALLDVLTGREEPEGRLPFELPSSMAAVEAQDPGLPQDSVDPLYPILSGLGY
jgi:hypothetical protein